MSKITRKSHKLPTKSHKAPVRARGPAPTAANSTVASTAQTASVPAAEKAFTEEMWVLLRRPGVRIFQAPEGVAKQGLLAELGDRVLAEFGGLIFCRGLPGPVYWHWGEWKNPRWIEIESIQDGVRKLRALGAESPRKWHLHSLANHRRAALIADGLPRGQKLQTQLLSPQMPLKPGDGVEVVVWALPHPQWLLVAPQGTGWFPEGVPPLAEIKQGPPSRAYRKLWEWAVGMGRRPQPGQKVLELGGCPGGWTWLLAQWGAQVEVWDRTPLEPAILKLPSVKFHKGDVFALKPGEYAGFDWIVSDVVCFPERLLEWLDPWVQAHPQANFVFTIKFKGAEDYHKAQAFPERLGGGLVHLYHNKNELTWFRLATFSELTPKRS